MVRLTSDEDARGYVYWVPADRPIRVVELNNDGNPVRSIHLSNPQGSVMPPGIGRFQFAIDGLAPGSAILVRLVDDFGCAIWEGTSGQQLRFRFVPNHGVFHRVVVDAGRVEWPADCVLRAGDALVRFLNGRVEGERVAPIDSVEIEQGRVSFTAEPSGTFEAEGRFIEVVVPGSDEHEAEANCEALLGLLRLMLGESAVGPKVFEARYDTTGMEQLGVLDIPVSATMPRSLPDGELDQVDLLIPLTLGLGQGAESRRVALHWFHRGETSSSLRERFLAYFIGIERLISGHAGEEGPLPAETGRQHLIDDAVAALTGRRSTDEVEWVRSRLAGSSLSEKCAFFVQARGLPHRLVEAFRLLNRTRNDLFHGRVARIDASTANSARDVLLQFLKSEFGLVGQLGWEAEPAVRSPLRVHYALTEAEPPVDATDPA